LSLPPVVSTLLRSPFLYRSPCSRARAFSPKTPAASLRRGAKAGPRFEWGCALFLSCFLRGSFAFAWCRRTFWAYRECGRRGRTLNWEGGLPVCERDSILVLCLREERAVWGCGFRHRVVDASLFSGLGGTRCFLEGVRLQTFLGLCCVRHNTKSLPPFLTNPECPPREFSAAHRPAVISSLRLVFVGTF